MRGVNILVNVIGNVRFSSKCIFQKDSHVDSYINFVTLFTKLSPNLTICEDLSVVKTFQAPICPFGRYTFQGEPVLLYTQFYL